MEVITVLVATLAVITAALAIRESRQSNAAIVDELSEVWGAIFGGEDRLDALETSKNPAKKKGD